MEILSDRPIFNKNEDLFKRLEFVKLIANGILENKSDESFCIALNGTWGSGKSSIINLCLEEIRNKTKSYKIPDKPLIIQFRPWLISGREQLIIYFLTQLRDALKRPDLSKHAHEAAIQLEKYEKILTIATYIPHIKRFAEKVKDAVSNLRKTSQTIARQSQMDLESNKESICEALKKLSSSVIIIIDDVDRLTDEEIRQLFQMIKAVADFLNTIYLLAFDYLIVEKSLNKIYPGQGGRYLEKIIQLNFEVPNPEYHQLEIILLNSLEDIINTISSDREEQKRWNEIRFGALPLLFRNTRDIKKYLNIVNFVFHVLKEEVNSIDLLMIEAIHLFTPNLYLIIKNSKRYLTFDKTSSTHPFGDLEDEATEKWVNELFEKVPEEFRSGINMMLSYLFPNLSGVRIEGSVFAQCDKNKRICISSYFDYYFQGTLPQGEVSSKQLNEIISALKEKDNLTFILKNYMHDGRIISLLPKIEDYFKDEPNKDYIQNFLISIFESGESLQLKPTPMSQTNPDLFIVIEIYRILKFININERKDTLYNAMNLSKNAIFFPVRIANFIYNDLNPSNNQTKQDKEEEKIMSQEDAVYIKNTALTLLREYKDGDLLYRVYNLHSILLIWESWSSSDVVKVWVNSIFKDDKKIPYFLRGFGNYSSKQSSLFYQENELNINHKHIENYCDIMELKRKCEVLLATEPEWLNDIQKECLNLFLESFIKKYR